ncbi:MAG: cytochrome c [Wenzhouxiangellaceae bacterium]|nr:cytochrome c [Wenzhouxiangellaceae bacterium]MBS3745660.1 cytochrome c [Wenzhouxiangellaceae bacterium]MBS3822440.1 cytochrome c [Wenzhouxiangellaceae bacterium]
MKTSRSRRYCRRAAATVAAGLALLVLAGCSDEPDVPLQPGEAEYVRYCSTCHARDGAGRPPAFPPLAGSEWLGLGPEAVSLVVLLGLRGEIEVAGRTYRGYMPNMRQVNDEELAAVLGFIADRWAQWDGTPDAGRLAALRARIADEELLEGKADLERLLQRIEP